MKNYNLGMHGRIKQPAPVFVVSDFLLMLLRGVGAMVFFIVLFVMFVAILCM